MNPNNKTTKDNPVGRFMVAVGAVIEFVNSGEILIIQRDKSLDWQPAEWEIIYGRLDQFETPEDGLQREAKEEIGLTDLVIGNVLSTWHIYRGDKSADNELIGITYACQTNTRDIKLSYEHSEYRWVKPEQALELIKVDGISRDIRLYQDLKERELIQ